MGNTRDEKRAALRSRLIEAAEDQIARHGIGGLKARAVTTQAGCALGALYTAFEDLDMLILHVNARTLERLGSALKSALGEGQGTPAQALQAMAWAYVDFACANRALWIALFEHRLPEGVETPDWHKQDHAVLIEVLIGPLSQLRPDLAQEALVLRARTTFAAVHGVVLLALQGRFVGVPMAQLHAEVAALVETMTRGSERGQAETAR
ncbi:TetR/AcrR family transcriptional regulator [Thioclava sp. BHET1]|nr:TetR/AcrR family transcriptional regulator [Thioclava sp. BHET1]